MLPAPCHTRLLVPGSTCWRIERASRMSIIVDAADYFAAAKQAIAHARRSVILIGWDFDTRIKLDPRGKRHTLPDELGDFLEAVVRRNPRLRVRILKWDLSMLKMPFRGRLPIFLLDLLSDGRLTFRLDHEHPASASHHQKIVVIDDIVAFAGGIDMTTDRWDTPEHSGDSPFRVRPSGRPYPPWHDATAIVEGPAARALGDLARDRWWRATGEKLPRVPVGESCWPGFLKPDFQDVDVAIARTAPAHRGRPAVREIEALWVAAFESAKHFIYVEQQYLASPKLADILVRRLGEPDGPEIMVVTPYHHQGWLEAVAMGDARRVLLSRLRAADCYGRFRIYAPVTADGRDIYVHAKVLVVDDSILRVGSSNMNNRSMGLDTECDLAIEAADDETCRSIRNVRHSLLAEHLGQTVSAVADLEQELGSLVRMVEELRRTPGKTLVPLEIGQPSELEETIVDAHLLDPDRPEPISEVIRRGSRRFPGFALRLKKRFL